MWKQRSAREESPGTSPPLPTHRTGDLSALRPPPAAAGTAAGRAPAEPPPARGAAPCRRRGWGAARALPAETGGSEPGGAALGSAESPGRDAASARQGDRGHTRGLTASEPLRPHPGHPPAAAAFPSARPPGRGKPPRPPPPCPAPHLAAGPAGATQLAANAGAEAAPARAPQLPCDARRHGPRPARPPRRQAAEEAGGRRPAGPRGRSRSRRPGFNSPAEAPRPAPAAAEPGPPLRPPAGRTAAPVAPSRCGSSSASFGGRRRPPPGRSRPSHPARGATFRAPTLRGTALAPAPPPGLGPGRTPDAPRPTAPGAALARPRPGRPAPAPGGSPARPGRGLPPGAGHAAAARSRSRQPGPQLRRRPRGTSPASTRATQAEEKRNLSNNVRKMDIMCPLIQSILRSNSTLR